MILTKKVKIKINKQNIQHYILKYNDIKLKDELLVNPEDLSTGSHKEILVKCDKCGTEKVMMYKTYLINLKDDLYFCFKCNGQRKKETWIKIYGTTHPLKSKKVMDKLIDTNLKKYGVEFSSMTKESQEKRYKTNLEKYGFKNPLQNENVKNKIKETNLEKYGVEHPIQNEIIRNKIKNKVKELYGKDYAFHLKSYDYKDLEKNKKIKEKTNETKFKNLKNKYKDINFISQDEENFIIYCEKCHKNYKIEKSLFSNRIKIKTILCTECNPINSFSNSGMELQLLDFIKTIYKGEIILNSRKVIYPYEIDIYLPEEKIAFEFNGLWWHNELYKPKDYHKKKSDLCEEKDIKLLHIWEDDWRDKQNIVKQIITNILNKKNKIKIHEFEIKEVKDYKEIKNFLQENYINEFVKCPVNIGLFRDKELISLMCLEIKDNILNIIIYCEKLNTYVEKGFHNIVEFAYNKYIIDEIKICCDRSYCEYFSYINEGFSIYGKSKPKCYYIEKDKRTLNKSKYKIHSPGDYLLSKRF